MNKYIFLTVLNIPLILYGIIDAIVDYKASKSISKHRCIGLIVFWLLIGLAIIMVEPLYNSLIRANLTDSPPLSIFDAVLLTSLVFCILLIVKINVRLSAVNNKLSRVHERVAIMESLQESDKK